ncbi:MAG: PEP-CTERM sorting domain-containing protein [Gemmataceae bacterium]
MVWKIASCPGLFVVVFLAFFGVLPGSVVGAGPVAARVNGATRAKPKKSLLRLPPRKPSRQRVLRATKPARAQAAAFSFRQRRSMRFSRPAGYFTPLVVSPPAPPSVSVKPASIDPSSGSPPSIASNTPEPASLVSGLVGAGLVAVFWKRKKSRQTRDYLISGKV